MLIQREFIGDEKVVVVVFASYTLVSECCHNAGAKDSIVYKLC